MGCDVWWIEPYPVRLPRLGDLRRLRSSSRKAGHSHEPAWSNAPWLKVKKPGSLPMEPLPGGAALLAWLQTTLRAELAALLAQADTWLAIGRPSGMALALCAARQGQRVLYDVMDDMPQFSQGLSQRWMRKMHERLLGQAEVVWGSSTHIVQSLAGRTRHDAALVRNGVTVPNEPVPADVRSGVGSRTHAQAPLVLGYVGTIAAWFDWQALQELALALPQARIEVYGPLECAPPAALPPNVRLLGPVPHARVFALMRGWHAGLIPFVRNRLTQSVDPVKYYEYRACGLPVLTTPFGEMLHHAADDDGVWLMEPQASHLLEARLRDWHTRLSQRHAQGLPLEPDCLQKADWRSRFNQAAESCGLAPDGALLPSGQNDLV